MCFIPTNEIDVASAGPRNRSSISKYHNGNLYITEKRIHVEFIMLMFT
jgi:hypothetical protein